MPKKKIVNKFMGKKACNIINLYISTATCLIRIDFTCISYLTEATKMRFFSTT